MTALSKGCLVPWLTGFSLTIRLVFIVASALTLVCFSANAQSTYCAFEVLVRSPSGKPVTGVTVALIRRSKAIFSESVTDAQGVARLCDAPLEYMDVVVGRDVCGSVLVRHLKHTWPETRRVYVTYVDDPCDHFGVESVCRILLRIVDNAGRPLEGVGFNGVPPNQDEHRVSDIFGRLYYSLMRGQTLEGTVSKEGKRPARVSTSCVDDKEITVHLQER